MIEFWLNDRPIRTSLPAGMPLVDFIRREEGLKGVKVGCREGDCGACLVLEGRLRDDLLSYQSLVSCLATLGRVHGRHIVTIEGLAGQGLTPVQKLLRDHHAAQCGFCTPGIGLALTAFCLSDSPATAEKALASLDGNLCRCTGYQSIKEAARELARQLPAHRTLTWLIREGYLPPYFGQMEEALRQIPPAPPTKGRLLGGGTDLMVQSPDLVFDSTPQCIPAADEKSGIRMESGSFVLDAGVTTSQMLAHPGLRGCFPELEAYGQLIASTPIRNMATLGGNLVNASPIADWAVFLLALDTSVLLRGPSGLREIPLVRFFKGYKQLDLQAGERLEGVRFAKPSGHDRFHFEKVSKRRHLDIASVNSAAFFQMANGRIQLARLSAGGVSPVPLFLKATSHFLTGKRPEVSVLEEARHIAMEEIAPISDVRGSAGYKRLLLGQLLYAHFLKCFPKDRVHEKR